MCWHEYVGVDLLFRCINIYFIIIASAFCCRSLPGWTAFRNSQTSSKCRSRSPRAQMPKASDVSRPPLETRARTHLVLRCVALRSHKWEPLSSYRLRDLYAASCHDYEPCFTSVMPAAASCDTRWIEACDLRCKRRGSQSIRLCSSYLFYCYAVRPSVRRSVSSRRSAKKSPNHSLAQRR